jgi:RND family efflux transporter MFP subunit
MTTQLICLLLVSALLGACNQEVAEPEERIRAVKTIIVADLASDQQRKFPGTVEPVESSNLSFEVNGVIRAIHVDVGDRFKKDEVLAFLDNKPFQINVESARAALSRASAQLAEKKSAYEREVRIQAEDPGATTEKAVEQSRAAYDSQVQNVSYNQAQLDLAERDLINTELRAPFNGIVSARYVDPSEVADRGVHVFKVNTEGAMQVAVSVPEQMIDKVYSGLEGQVFLSNQPDEPYEAVVSEVGSAATTANAFPVTAIIIDAGERVRPGMTAELRLIFSDEEMQIAYLIPGGAFLPGIDRNDRHVYLFDAETSTVRKTAVQTGGIQGDHVIVTEGIAPGDVLVVAGVPFLSDGQEVKLLDRSGAMK